jgi:hypothetical protein
LVGYGKYYESLAIPDSTYFTSSVSFSKKWIDSLSFFEFKELSKNNKISYRIIENELNRIVWSVDTFKQQEWDPSIYNLGEECYTIITEPYGPLDERLKTLSKHLQFAGLITRQL